ncbi:hypothetical protein [Streptomyces sp. NPDC044948]|uniref:hypothetical protein n=1 Tax=Streptomyces sp. NPDC044948 TaxID=3157092 RepID=UPI0033F1A3B9
MEHTGLTEQAPPPGPASATPGGLPVRSPGRTMAEAERERRGHRGQPADRTATASRDAGASFGAFHRGRRTGSAGRPEPGPPAPG